MLEKSGSSFIASCDFCSNYIDTDESEFMSAVEHIKRLGWRIFLEFKEWMHKCDMCCRGSGDDFEDVE